MKKLLALLLVWLFATTAASAQNAITLPIAAQAVADIGNGPIKVRVTQGNASIFTAQGSGVGSTSGSSTALTLTTTPATAPIVGGLISGSGVVSGTTVTAYNGTTGVTLSAAMTVAGGTSVSWGAACPSSSAGIPSQYIQASVQADYYLLYTQARVCAVSPGGPVNTLLILPIFYDQTTTQPPCTGLGCNGLPSITDPKYKADPTGVNDSWAAITACWADNLACGAPPGNYALSRCLSPASTQTLIGFANNPYNTRLFQTTAATPLVCLTDGVVDAAFFNLWLDRTVTATSGGDGIYAPGTNENAQFGNLYVTNNWTNLWLGGTGNGYLHTVISGNALSHGIVIKPPVSGGQWQFDDVYSTQSGGSGTGCGVYATDALTSAGMTMGSWRTVRTFANQTCGVGFFGTAGKGIFDIEWAGGFLGDNGDDVTFDTHGSNNRVANITVEAAGQTGGGPGAALPATGVGVGIHVTANNDRLQVLNTIAISNSQEGIYNLGTNVSVNNNQTYANGVATPSAGIRMGVGSSGTAIGNTSTLNAYGMQTDVDGWLAVGNNLNGNTTAAFNPTAGFVASVLVGNLPNSVNIQPSLRLSGSSTGTLTQVAPANGGASSLTWPAGTTDFSATGGASQVVKQASAGGAFTVARLACSDLSNAGTGCPAAAGITVLTGDVTATGPGSAAATLASVITAGGPTGSATVAPIITYDAKGRLTAVSSATITPAVGSITGFGTGVGAALAINIGTTGAPVLLNGAGGTPSSITLTNATGTAAGLTAGTVTTNANLTGAITSTGNATSLGSFSSANLSGALTDETGSGVAVFGTSPVLSTVDARGTWTTGTSWTLPAFTLGGTISGGNKNLNDIVIGAVSPHAISGTALAGTSLSLTTSAGLTNGITITDAATYTFQVGSSGGNQVNIGGTGGTPILGFLAGGTLNAQLGAGFSVGTTTDAGSGTVNAAGAYYANGTKGVTCSGALTVIASVTIKSGIITAATGTGGTCS